MSIADDIAEMEKGASAPSSSIADSIKEMDVPAPSVDRSGEIPKYWTDERGNIHPGEKPGAKPAYTRSTTEKALDYALAPLDVVNSIIRGIPASFLTAGPATAPSQQIGAAIAGHPYTQAGGEFLDTLGKWMDASKLGGLGPSESVALAGAKPPPGSFPILSAPPLPKVGSEEFRRQVTADEARRAAVEMQRQLEIRQAATRAQQVSQTPPAPITGVPVISETPVPVPRQVPTATVPAATGPATPISAAESVPMLPDAKRTAELAARASPEVRAELEAAAAKGGVNVDAAKRQLEADSLPVPMRLTPGQARQDPAMISDEMNRRAKIPGMVEHMNGQNDALKQNLNAIRSKAAPGSTDRTIVDNGRTLIGEYSAMDAAAQADIAAKYKALEEANGGSFPVNGQAFVDSADAALKKKMKGRYLPGEIRGDLDDIKANGGQMTFEQFENMRTTLAAETRKAERAGDGNRVAALSTVRQALEDLPITGESEQIKPLADAARAAARARFDRIKSDPAYRAVVNESAKPEDFVDKYIARAGENDIKAMTQNLTSQGAKDAMASGMVNHLKGKAAILPDDTGNFAAQTFRKELAKNDHKLDLLMPGDAAQDLRTLGNVSHYTTSQPKGSYVNNSNTLTGAIREGAVGIAEHAANSAAMSHGIPVPAGSWMRDFQQHFAKKREAREMLKPGAGVEEGK